jgi:magnesium-transporting ATPase (P-type)
MLNLEETNKKKNKMKNKQTYRLYKNTLTRKCTKPNINKLKFHKKANTDQKFTKNFNAVQNLFGKLQHAVAVRKRMG